jgi:hypothetical protein
MALISIVDGANRLLYTPPSFMHGIALFMVAGAGKTAVANHRELSARDGATTEPANGGMTTPVSLSDSARASRHQSSCVCEVNA